MNPMNTPVAGSAFLQELEVEVCTELTLAETGLPEEEAVSLPIEECLSDPEDEQRYEAGLHNLLDAVEAMRRTETED